MAEKSRGGPVEAVPSLYGFPTDTLDDVTQLPDYDTDFISPEDLEAFVQALAAPDPLQSPAATASAGPGEEGNPLLGAGGATPATLSKRNSIVSNTDGAGNSLGGVDGSLFITAKNDWAPVREKVEGAEGSASATASATAPAGRRRTATFISASSAWLPSFLTWKKAPASSNTSTNTTKQEGNGVSSKRSRRQEQQRRRAAAASAAAGKRSRKRDKQGALSIGRRTRDETREGYLYGLLKWPFLIGVFGWIIGLSIAYLLTRMYIAMYEQLVTWRGRRERLRHRMRATDNYADWVTAANALDTHLGNDRWKEENEFAFYDFRTVRRVADQLRKCRARAEAAEEGSGKTTTTEQDGGEKKNNVGDLKALVEACVKNNFAGIENRHLYSRTYYGTKNLVQSFVDEVERSLEFLIQTNQLDAAEKRAMFKRLYANYGRTALCLSGGASFAYYHFGVVRALLDEDLLPNVITGTSGGALVAALVATRTNDELRQLLVPALAGKINACSEPLAVWFRRWWKTGARFDSVDWAHQCAWWSHGSMTFREAYERTGRILNVTCVPADPHSPTILCNYRTAPDCVIWSAVLASAAVPGILNPVVLMIKTPGGRLVPYSFGHKWKDGSLRTDIPIKALNLHFNVNFTIVSQVNPHVNLFFFSSRGSVGQPVTHRKGRGWRGGYLGSAFEEYLKQDLRKWLKLLRNLELLPRLMGQDWSELWLQPFSGTITIWPKSIPSDFVRLLSDPDPPRLARMLHEGRQSAFPPLKFISNRLRVERLVERGRLQTRSQAITAGASSSSTGNAGSTSSANGANNNNDNNSGRGRGSLRLTGLGGGPGHAVSSSLDSLMSDDGLNGHARQRQRRRDIVSGVGLGLGTMGGGLGSTTATSDENNYTSDSDDDLDLSGGGPGVAQALEDSYDESGKDIDYDDEEVPIVEETEADD